MKLYLMNRVVTCCWCGTQKHETSYDLVGLQECEVLVLENVVNYCWSGTPKHETSYMWVGFQTYEVLVIW